MKSSPRDEIDAILMAAQRPNAPSRRPRRRGFYERAKQRRRRTGLTLNLTPMVDTVFNLLFFFMLVSRFGAIEGLLAAKLPTRSAATASLGPKMPTIPRIPIKVRLDSDLENHCRFRIDRLAENEASIRDLPARLAQIRDHEPGFGTDTPIYLVAGDSVAWDHVVNAYNAAVGARYEKVYFAGEK